MEANKERADKSTAEVEEYRTARLAFENKIQASQSFWLLLFSPLIILSNSLRPARR